MNTQMAGDLNSNALWWGVCRNKHAFIRYSSTGGEQVFFLQNEIITTKKTQVIFHIWIDTNYYQNCSRVTNPSSKLEEIIFDFHAPFENQKIIFLLEDPGWKILNNVSTKTLKKMDQNAFK